VLRVRTFDEKTLGEQPGVDSDAGSPAKDSLGGPLGVLLMRDGHVSRNGGVPPLNATPRMNCFAAASLKISIDVAVARTHSSSPRSPCGAE